MAQLLSELDAVREAPTEEAHREFVTALWRRTVAEITDLSIQFSNAGMPNIAAMCRAVAIAKRRPAAER